MKLSRIVSDCRAIATVRPTLAIFLLAARLCAQPVAGSLTTQSLPFFGQTIFDSAGNMYASSGPVTAGAAQTQAGGGFGNCFANTAPTAHIGIFPGPCTDAYIGKFDPTGTPIGSTTVSVSFGVPGLYRAQPGYSSQLLAINADGTLNSASNPAASGSVVALLGTGFGPTDPACTAGGLNDDFAASLASPLSVTLNQPSQVVTYAGSAPTLLCGITQINVRVSSNPGPMYLQAWSEMSIPGGISTAEGNFITSMLYVK